MHEHCLLPLSWVQQEYSQKEGKGLPRMLLKGQQQEEGHQKGMILYQADHYFHLNASVSMSMSIEERDYWIRTPSSINSMGPPTTTLEEFPELAGESTELTSSS